ncbi:MAG: STAS/SEC14 domain-containing protein [Candidatus Sulfotelmatobacter sp.]
MNSDETVSGTGEERLRFIKHKGHAIFVIDFSHCQGKEILFLLEQVKAIVTRHAPASMLILGDFTGADVDKKVATRMKEVATLDRPYVKRSAWVGSESMPHVFYENIKSFSHREIPTFQTREEAMDWLVDESHG